VIRELQAKKIDLVVLAGFLWLVPETFIKAFRGKIINIHPALLPGVGGKGMYGDKVHATVIQNKSAVSGITIHYVNEKFDEGEIIFRAECEIADDETAETLAGKVHALEYQHYPPVIERLLASS
jgi:phosphoribosylglycinamide formyltransferase-1